MGVIAFGPFHSILPFHSIPFHSSNPSIHGLHSIPFHSIPFHSIIPCGNGGVHRLTTDDTLEVSVHWGVFGWMTRYMVESPLLPLPWPSTFDGQNVRRRNFSVSKWFNQFIVTDSNRALALGSHRIPDCAGTGFVFTKGGGSRHPYLVNSSPRYDGV